MAFVLSASHYQMLKKELDDFLDSSEASTVLLLDRGGNVLVESGESVADRAETISALAAGAFAATQALAQVLGEEEFTVIFHQGRRTSIFVASVSEEALLLALFTDSTTVGLVKMYAVNACRHISSLFKEITTGKQAPAAEPTQTFTVSKGPLFKFDGEP